MKKTNAFLLLILLLIPLSACNFTSEKNGSHSSTIEKSSFANSSNSQNTSSYGNSSRSHSSNFSSNTSSEHVHTYKEEWSFDETSHWHAATCGHDVKKDVANHTFTESVTEPTGVSGGFTTHTCSICGYSFRDNETQPLTYTITWKNYDGSILEIDNNVSYGTVPSFDGTIPDHPRGEGDAEYYYEFSNWSEKLTPVESDKTYTANFERKYLFSFKAGNSFYSLEKCLCPTIEWTEVPQRYKGVEVGSIKAGAFGNCSLLKSIAIPDTVELIGKGIFEGCISLETIRLPFVGSSPNSDDYLGYLFGGDSASQNNEFIPSSLTKIELGSRTTTIKEDCFKYCASLKEIYLPDSVISIEKNSFASCKEIETMKVPFVGGSKTNNTYLGYLFNADLSDEDAYKMVPRSLKTLKIGKGSNKIYSNSFNGCVCLTNIEILNPDLQEIELNVLNSCIRIESLTLPFVGHTKTDKTYLSYLFGIDYPNGWPWIDTLKTVSLLEGVTDIGESAFAKFSSLETVNLPSTVRSIGKYAFWLCSSLTSIVLPAKVETIGQSAFLECSSLKQINIPEGITCIEAATFAKADLISITIPRSVTTIKQNAFKENENLRSLTLYGPVDQGDGSAFAICPIDNIYFYGTLGEWLSMPKKPFGISYNCVVHFYDNSEEIDEVSYVIDEGTESIDLYAFDGWRCLKSISIPTSVKTIGWGAFRNCSSLETIVIPEGVTTISGYTFYGCKSLKNIVIPTTLTSIDDFAFFGCSSLTSVALPSGVNSIGACAFKGCTMLNSINIPNGLDKIENSCFNGCSSLETISLPESVTEIEPHAFDGCSSLKTISVGTKIESIGGYAFNNCASLLTISLPEGLKTIEQLAFNGCKSLNSIVLPSTLTELARYSFSGCESLESINIPNGIVTIKEATFSNCHSLKEVIFPSTLKTIEGSAFYDCGFKNLTLPSGLESIGFGAFLNCYNLEWVVLPKTLTSISQSAFVISGKTSLKILFFGTYTEYRSINNEEGSGVTIDVVYYYSEAQPIVDGNYWHFVDGIPTVW